MSPQAPTPEPARDFEDLPTFDGPVTELDVRDDLRHKREPFSRIMAAVESLEPDGVLHLRATFEPVPLFRVLGRQGFSHIVREWAPDDWSVWFHRTGSPADGALDTPTSSSAERTPAPPPDASTDREITLDVRGLEPPEPMVKTLSALESLPADAVLVQHNERVPQFLLPILSERGFQYEVDESAPDMVVVRIRRAT